MNKISALLLTGLSLILLSSCKNETVNNSSVTNLYIWSHNDYEQELPLQTALDLGFQIIEADIHLIDGELYVIHDHPENPDETPLLDELYLTPIRERIEQNNGQVLPESKLPFYLVIDVKTEAESTFQALLETIEPYKDIIYRKEDGNWIDGPVRLLISGNRPSLDSNAPNQIVFLDGRLPNIGMGYSADLYPLISDNWSNYFSWEGTGDIPEDELQKLKNYVAQVHDEEKMIRFWGSPNREEVWRVLINAGVDVINVDDLEGMRHFLDEEFPVN